MNRLVLRMLVLGFAWVSSVCTAVADDPPKMQFNDVKEVAPGVFFRYSSISATDPKIPFGGSNNIWIVFKDYVVVIDANFPKEAGDVIQAIRKTTDKPIRYVLDTHHHGDHAYGNAVWVKEGATIVSQKKCFELLTTKGPDEFKKAGEGPTGRKDVAGSTLAPPTLFFDDKLVLDDGNQRVEFHFFGHAHTPGDASAYLPKHKILCTGDACVNGSFNYMGHSDSASWIKVLEKMEQLDVQWICPGHGPVAAAKDLLAKQKRYFVDLRREVKKGIDGGKTLDDIVKNMDLPWYKEWTGKDAFLNKDNIEHVYKELTGQIPATGLIEELGLKAGKGYCKTTPGWKDPRRIVVPNLAPARLAELKLMAPTVEFVMARTVDEAAQAAADADAVLGFCSPAIIQAGKRLRWLHIGGQEAAPAGSPLPSELLAGSPITLTTSQPADAPQVADNVYAMLLCQMRGLRRSLDDAQWRQQLKPEPTPQELRGKTMLVVGLNALGREVARRGNVFGMKIVAIDTNQQPRPEFVSEVARPDRLMELLPVADVVVLASPATDPAAPLFGQRQDHFSAMKPTAQIVVVGNLLVQPQALQKALTNKTIAGASLDGVTVEVEDSLWRMPNVLIMPPLLDQSPEGADRQWRLWRENVRRFVAGEPLLAVVNESAP